MARKSLWKPGLRSLLREPDHVFAMSLDLVDLVEDLVPGIRAEGMTNAVDVTIFRRRTSAPGPAPGPRLLVPSRLHPVKGVEYFVRAMSELVTAFPSLEAVLAGDGPERQRLEDLARQLGVAERIHFLGTRPHAEMPGILSSVTLAVLPSLMEATSIAALEAMACELPVAASRVGGLPQIVDESVGTLFEPADPGDLAEKVIALLRRGDLEQTGRRGRERVARKWSNDFLVERHLEVYRALKAGERVIRA